MTPTLKQIDVLCVGHASYDLVFSIPHHPLEDEKLVAEGFVGCGGGPAANAAVTVCKLGLNAAFAGYLGQDLYGEKHWQELNGLGVQVHLIARGMSPTPVSTVLVKPDGKRALINYKGDTQALAEKTLDFTGVNPKVILFDGHEPHISRPLVEQACKQGIPSVLDAGSMHDGTLMLMEKVNYLVCSEKFALQYAGNEEAALTRMAEFSPVVVITLGARGLLWRRGQDHGSMPAFPITAVDTTGAGDAFHGAFAAALSQNLKWLELLRYASAAGALCCTKTGAREGIPDRHEHQALYES